MVQGIKPVILLEKETVPVPSSVFEFAVVGFVVVLQHTPLAVIDPPAASRLLPPDVAVVEPIAVIAMVVTIG